MRNPKVIVVGAGFSGIAMGYYLKQMGIEDFIIIEKARAIGGTWYENKYPGAECDVESHLYCFSFFPKADWSKIFSGSNEIEEYIADCTRHFGIYNHIVFDECVEKSTFENNQWTIKTDKNSYTCKYFIPSCSPLHCPIFPNIKDFDKFAGKVMHTAQWDHSYDFRGKKVAIIGNAASGVQCIPELAEVVDKLYVFQRTANWIIPKFNRPFTSFEKWVYQNVPYAEYLYRRFLFHYHEFFFACFRKGHWSGPACAKLTEYYIAYQVKDVALREKLIPKYTFGCKRVLLSDNYFPTFNNPRVTLVTDKITSLSKEAVHTSADEKIVVDCVVCATGFDVFAPVQNMHISNLKDSKAFMGIYVKNAPNLFLLLGPNTGSAHTGIPLYVEPQAQHIAEMIQRMEDTHKSTVTVKDEVFDKFNVGLTKDLDKYVWDQCDNWYKQTGANDTLYPGSLKKFVRVMNGISMEDFNYT